MYYSNFAVDNRYFNHVRVIFYLEKNFFFFLNTRIEERNC